MKPTENDDLLDHLDCVNDGDFIFIVDDAGSLKTVLVPEEFDYDTNQLPKNLQRIFKIFGIQKLTQQTLH